MRTASSPVPSRLKTRATESPMVETWVRETDSMRSSFMLQNNASTGGGGHAQPRRRVPVRRYLERAGTGLSNKADTSVRRLCARRLRRRRHPAARQGARAAPRTAASHRVSARERGRRSDGGDRKAARRRLYALLLRQRTADDCAAPQ